MSKKIVKPLLDEFESEIKKLYSLYLNEKNSFKKTLKSLRQVAELHRKKIIKPHKFTNHSIVRNLAKSRDIIKKYINLEVIEDLRRKNTYFWIFKSSKLKDLKGIKAEDMNNFSLLKEKFKRGEAKNYFPFLMDYFKFPAWLIERMHKYQINTINTARERREIVPFNIKTYRAIIKLLMEESEDIRFKFFATLLATGRRPAEILKISLFEEKGENMLLIKKIAKKREHNKKHETSFPTLYNARELLNAIEKIRYQERVAEFSKEELSDSLNSSYNKIFRMLFKDIFLASDSMYISRALYAKFSYLEYAPRTMEFNFWITKVLGHEDNDIITAFHYNKYVLEENGLPADNEILTTLERRINSYIKRKVNYAILKRERLEELKEAHKNSENAFYKTLLIIEELMGENDSIELKRGLNSRIREAFLSKFAQLPSFIKLKEYLEYIFNNREV